MNVPTESDCNIRDSEVKTDKVYNLNTFKFKNINKPYLTFGMRKNTTVSKGTGFSFDLKQGYHKISHK